MRFVLTAALAVSLLAPTAALSEEPATDADFEHLFYQAAYDALHQGGTINHARADGDAEPLFHATMKHAIAEYQDGMDMIRTSVLSQAPSPTARP